MNTTLYHQPEGGCGPSFPKRPHPQLAQISMHAMRMESHPPQMSTKQLIRHSGQFILSLAAQIDQWACLASFAFQMNPDEPVWGYTLVS